VIPASGGLSPWKIIRPVQLVLSAASPTASRNCHGQAGFTLLELLVALVVVGLLLAGLGQALHGGLLAWTAQGRRTAADLDSMERLLRRMIAEADPGNSATDIAFHGEPHRLSFLTRLPHAFSTLPPGEAPNADAEVTVGIDAQQRLVLRWLPTPNAKRIGPPPVAGETVLAEGVTGLDLAYARTAEQGGLWQATWATPLLPTLVRIRLVFRHGDARRWPDIVEATRRTRPQS